MHANQSRPKQSLPDAECQAIDDSNVVIDSIALGRLIEEVRTTETAVERNYNRTYNRHNR
jgi:hypothetical protein